MSSSPAKIYSPGEERLNVYTHRLGAAAVLLAGAGLTGIAALRGSEINFIAVAVYVVSLFAMFAGSASYHYAKDPAERAKLRVLDHAAIYLLIAGTYTPLMLLMLPNWHGYSVLATVWALALAGITLEILKIKPFKGFSILLYVLMGWACMAVLPQLTASMSAYEFSFLLWGGIAYTAGVPFYICRKNYCHALWHVFVLAGAALHFISIAWCLLTLP